MSDTKADIQTVEITSYDKETAEMQVKAKQVAEVLTKHYPNHLWMIGWAPGMTLVVKHGAGDNRYGYTIDARTLTDKELTRMALIAGGELLERMGMPRGRWDGEGFGLPYQM